MKAVLFSSIIMLYVPCLWAAEPVQHNEEGSEQAVRQNQNNGELSEAEKRRILGSQRAKISLERARRSWQYIHPKSSGVVLIFHQWPDEDQAQVIEEYLKPEGLQKADVLELSKMWTYTWSETQLEKRAERICADFPQVSSMDRCVSNTLLVPIHFLP